MYLFVCLPVLSNLHFGIDLGRKDPGPNRPTGKRVNGGDACGDTPYRETNVDTSYMRIVRVPNENSVC